jgi:pimeloyl-ACP methyl ester carboxylesterase
MRRALVALIAALVGVATACTGDASTRTDFEPSIRTINCPNEIAAVVLTELECGYLTVPEDRSDPGSRSIDVFYMRVEPAGRVVGEPYFSFGYEMAQVPSYASISPPGSSAQGNGPELILMDQRGVGHSAPSLACPEVEAVAPELVASSSDDREPFLDAVAECHRRLAGSGIDLSAYTTQEAADDADDLRRLLQIPSWNLISFGTSSRLLLETVRRHPDGIRALVMDSPQFPQVDDATSAADAIRSSLSNLERTCRQDKACDRAYPDLVSTFDEALARLDDSPETVSVELGGERRLVVVDGGALVRVIRHLLSFNDAGAHGAIPSIVYAARDGHVDAVAGVLARDPGMCVGYLPRCIFATSLGAYLSFTCSGQMPFIDAAMLARTTSQPGFAAAYGENPYLAACQIWDVEPVAATAHEPVSSDVPALIMWGEYDAFAPFDPIERAPETLTNANVLAVPYLGQDVFGTYDCTREIRNAWLPTLDPSLNTACLSTIPAPVFEIAT